MIEIREGKTYIRFGSGTVQMQNAYQEIEGDEPYTLGVFSMTTQAQSPP